MLFRSTSKGGYADYSTSNWARRERALAEDELEAIKTHGLFNLKDFLPKKPGEVELKVIKEMFEASVDGQPYDTERWGQYYRPAGVQAPAGGSSAGHDDEESTPRQAPAVAAKPAPAPFDDEDEPAVASAPVVTPAASVPAGNKAEDILAMIRARQNK